MVQLDGKVHVLFTVISLLFLTGYGYRERTSITWNVCACVLRLLFNSYTNNGHA